jgi:hypothetical protein
MRLLRRRLSLLDKNNLLLSRDLLSLLYGGHRKLEIKGEARVEEKEKKNDEEQARVP